VNRGLHLAEVLRHPQFAESEIGWITFAIESTARTFAATGARGKGEESLILARTTSPA